MSSSGEARLPTFFEFFAGGGMVRAGLGGGWDCLFANDFDPGKAEAYRANWGGRELRVADVAALRLRDLPPSTPDLVWASFPCQDLSLAGDGAGLSGERSGAFWPFWSLLTRLVEAGRGPSLVALENVAGALTSHGGEDFRAIVGAFDAVGYDVGALLVDARHFLPQSRPRLFFVGVPRGRALPALLGGEQADLWRPASLKRAWADLPERLKERWIWWDLPAPPARNVRLADLLEDEPGDVAWHLREETERLVSMMAPPHRARLEQAKAAGRRAVGCMYRRTRQESGRTVQRVEVRFDEVAGCLRTPAGGSSRQLLLIVDGESVRSRLVSARETARLMGLPDEYVLPERYNDAYHLTGDGVAVPVVRHLSEHIFLPQLGSRRSSAAAEAASRPARERRPRAA